MPILQASYNDSVKMKTKFQIVRSDGKVEVGVEKNDTKVDISSLVESSLSSGERSAWDHLDSFKLKKSKLTTKVL